MKTIKIIDLLNKIVNGEEVPNKIKYADYIFEWTGLNYYCNQFDVFLEKRICIEDLCYPVEIIEEDKEIEDTKYMRHHEDNGKCYIESEDHKYYVPYDLLLLIDNLVKAVNELKKGK